VLTVSGEFQQGWMAGAEGGQDGGFKFIRKKVPFRALNWLK